MKCRLAVLAIVVVTRAASGCRDGYSIEEMQRAYARPDSAIVPVGCQRSVKSGVDDWEYTYSCGRQGQDKVIALVGRAGMNSPRVFPGHDTFRFAERTRHVFLEAAPSGDGEPSERTAVVALLHKPFTLLVIIWSDRKLEARPFNDVLDSFLAIQDSDVDRDLYEDWARRDRLRIVSAP